MNQAIRALTCSMMMVMGWGIAASADTPATPVVQPLQGSEADFDFLMGEWQVHHRRRTHILQNADEWYEFEGSLAAHKVWNGRAHIDEFKGNAPSGLIEGMSFRIFDPAAKQWRDYYAGVKHRILDEPVVGGFTGKRGVFYSHEFYEGRAVLGRQIWTVLGPKACRWEQAYSVDGGVNWETNWIMDLTR